MFLPMWYSFSNLLFNIFNFFKTFPFFFTSTGPTFKSSLSKHLFSFILSFSCVSFFWVTSKWEDETKRQTQNLVVKLHTINCTFAALWTSVVHWRLRHSSKLYILQYTYLLFTVQTLWKPITIVYVRHVLSQKQH